MRAEHVVVVPSALALLPEYAGQVDPLPEVRAAAASAVSWLVDHHGDEVVVLAAGTRPDNAARGVTDPPGLRIGRHLLAGVGFTGRVVDEAAALLVVANGSARRGEKAPGHLDERSFDYDEAVEAALRAGTQERLRAVDVALGEELWAFDAPALRALGELDGSFEAEVDYAGDPFGVRYWVVRWTCVS
jgi:hypothetical protein